MGKMPIGPTARIAVLQRTGQGWIRTSEGVKPADLQSAPFGHSGTYPFASVDIGSRRMRRKCAQHWRTQFRHPERSRGIPLRKLKVSSRDPSTSLGMTYRWILAVKLSDLLHHKALRFATQLWINW